MVVVVAILTGPEGPVLQRRVVEAGVRRPLVAILTGPEGPVLPGEQLRAAWKANAALRSSPVPKGRCCPLWILKVADWPASVAILTGPEGPVLLQVPDDHIRDDHIRVGDVAILTGPEGPVLPPR